MIALNTDAAMAAALLGLSPSDAKLATLAQNGFMSAAWDIQKEKVDQLLVGSLDLRTRGIDTPVSLYRFNTNGQRKIETWPSVSFELVGCRYDPGPRRMHPTRDPIVVPVEGTVKTITSAAGTSITGYSMRSVRSHPEPYVVRYDVGAWSMENDEVLLLFSTVTERLPPNGGIRALWADGSEHPSGLQINLVNMVNADEEIPAISSPDRQRVWHWVLTYEIETWMDNTLATRLQRTIDQPVSPNLTPIVDPTAGNNTTGSS